MNKKMGKFHIYGTKAEIAKAEESLNGLEDREDLSEADIRTMVQRIIDYRGLKASILYGGNSIWSKKRILTNLRRIVKAGILYDGEKPTYIPIGSMLRMPTGGEPILSKYFYKFLHLCCGSIAHYNIRGWIAEYPTVEELRGFFKKNEFGKRVLDHVHPRMADVKEIVREIELILGRSTMTQFA